MIFKLIKMNGNFQMTNKTIFIPLSIEALRLAAITTAASFLLFKPP